MRSDGARQGLAAGAAAATVLLTGFAFWLSYEHLHDVSASNGLTGARAWAWPATIDLFIVIGELLMLRASLTRQGVDGWAVALTVVGSAGSIGLNVAGVGKGAPALTYVVAAVPPVAALLAFGALMRQVHERLAVAPEPVAELTETSAKLAEVPAEPDPVPVVLERVPEVEETRANLAPVLTLGPMVPVAELLAGTSREQGVLKSNNVPLVSPEPAEPAVLVPEPPTGTSEVPTGAPAAHVEAVREWLAAEPELTGTAIGTRLGTSDSYGRRVRRAALEHAGATS